MYERFKKSSLKFCKHLQTSFTY